MRGGGGDDVAVVSGGDAGMNDQMLTLWNA